MFGALAGVWLHVEVVDQYYPHSLNYNLAHLVYSNLLCLE